MSTETTSDASEIANKLLDFLHLAEKLKCTLRHNWTSTGRQESVAEHSWQLALMVMLIEPHLNEPIDLEKALKMALLDDGDRISPLVSSEPTGAGEIFDLWSELSIGGSNIAQFIKALGKIKAKLTRFELAIQEFYEMEHLDGISDTIDSMLGQRESSHNFLSFFGDAVDLLTENSE